MECQECGGELIPFRVPDELRDAAPKGASTAAICRSCLALSSAPGDEPASASPGLIEGFPEGRAGAAMALAVGLLVDSVALHRETIATLLEHVQDAGADPWLVFERLAVAPEIDPPEDLDRRARQLEQLLEG